LAGCRGTLEVSAERHRVGTKGQRPKDEPFPVLDERKNAVGGTADQVKGHVKEAAGEITNDRDLEREGKVDRATGEVKEKARAAKDKVSDAADSVRDKVKDALD
jgi:uncharacterized protein YjbJ (UPF0337 family)